MYPLHSASELQTVGSPANITYSGKNKNTHAKKYESRLWLKTSVKAMNNK